MKNENGKMWYDTTEAEIRTHEGMILQYQGKFYLYGENKGGPNRISNSGGCKVDFINNHLEGPAYRQSFHRQVNYVFEFAGQAFIMIDHLQPEERHSSGYSILSISIIGKRQRDLRIIWDKQPFGGKLEELFNDK